MCFSETDNYDMEMTMSDMSRPIGTSHPTEMSGSNSRALRPSTMVASPKIIVSPSTGDGDNTNLSAKLRMDGYKIITTPTPSFSLCNNIK